MSEEKLNPCVPQGVWALLGQSSWVLVRNWRSEIHKFALTREDLLLRPIPSADVLVLAQRTVPRKDIEQDEKREGRKLAGVLWGMTTWLTGHCCVLHGALCRPLGELSLGVQLPRARRCWDLSSGTEGILSLVRFLPLLKSPLALPSSFPFFVQERTWKGPFCFVCILVFTFLNLIPAPQMGIVSQWHYWDITPWLFSSDLHHYVGWHGTSCLEFPLSQTNEAALGSWEYNEMVSVTLSCGRPLHSSWQMSATSATVVTLLCTLVSRLITTAQYLLLEWIANGFCFRILSSLTTLLGAGEAKMSMKLGSSRTSCFPGGASGEELASQCRRVKRHEFDPWMGKISWRRAWQTTPVFLPKRSHGQRSLAGYSPRGRRVGHDWATQHNGGLRMS